MTDNRAHVDQPLWIVEGHPVFARPDLALVPVTGVYASRGAQRQDPQEVTYGLAPLAVIVCRPTGTERLTVGALPMALVAWMASADDATHRSPDPWSALCGEEIDASASPSSSPASASPSGSEAWPYVDVATAIDGDDGRACISEATFRRSGEPPGDAFLTLHVARWTVREETSTVQAGRRLGALLVRGCSVRIVTEHLPWNP